jgi:hypothetical protein
MPATYRPYHKYLKRNDSEQRTIVAAIISPGVDILKGFWFIDISVNIKKSMSFTDPVLIGISYYTRGTRQRSG